jgi:1,4-dihydroxy-6-naphthoate synthase
MYVNRRTLDVDEDGRESVRRFLDRGYEAGLIEVEPRVEFFEYTV